MLQFLVAFVLFYLWHGMGITVGYHRLLSHRAFRCNRLFEYFFVLGGYFAYQGSPIWWSAIHRAHHRYSDTALDPHSPRYGVKHALVGWMLDGKYPDHINPARQCKDLFKDPIYQVLECGGRPPLASLLNLIVNIGFRGMLWMIFGWQIALASLISSLLVFQVPQMLNVICHIPSLGYKNFATEDDSSNVWWVGLLGLGEGWHNNHHAFPGSARSGLRWFELDISWWTIKLGEILGLVYKANVPGDLSVRLAHSQLAWMRLKRLRKFKQQQRKYAA